MTRVTVQGSRLAPPRNAAVKLDGGRFHKASAVSMSASLALRITAIRSASARASL